MIPVVAIGLISICGVYRANINHLSQFERGIKLFVGKDRREILKSDDIKRSGRRITNYKVRNFLYVVVWHCFSSTIEVSDKLRGLIKSIKLQTIYVSKF